MIEQINGWLILTTCLLLLYFVIAALVEPYRERLRQLSRKISPGTLRTFFYLWVGILVLRKVLYYIPFKGIIQTPSSVKWVDEEVLISIYLVFIALLFLFAAIDISLIDIKSRKRRETFFNAGIICICIFGIFFGISMLLKDLPFIQLIISPFLVLKMLCSGRYTGLFVSFGLVYLILSGYKKIKPGKNRSVTKFLLVTGLIAILIGIFIFSQFSGNWEKGFLHKAQTAKDEREIEDLVDAVKNIKYDIQRLKIFKEIAAAVAGTGNKKLTNHFLKRFTQDTIRSGEPDDAKLLYLKVILKAMIIVNQKGIKADKDLFQMVILLAQTMEQVKNKSEAVREIILIIAGIGDAEADKELCQQAVDALQTMQARVKPGPIVEIAAAVAKTASQQWAKVIFLQLIEAAKTITTNGWFKYQVLKGVVEAAASRKDMKGEKEIFTAAINTANTINYWRNHALALKTIAEAAAKTGDLQWALSIVQRIPDPEIKNNTLLEILQKQIRFLNDEFRPVHPGHLIWFLYDCLTCF